LLANTFGLMAHVLGPELQIQILSFLILLLK
jgi:hypothetical protein